MIPMIMNKDEDIRNNARSVKDKYIHLNREIFIRMCMCVCCAWYTWIYFFILTIEGA